MIDYNEFRQIQVHLKYLKKSCNGCGVHPFDIQELWETRETLKRLTLNELDENGLDFHEVAVAIQELDLLLSKSSLDFC